MILQKRIAKRMRTAMFSEQLTVLELAEKLGIAKSSVQLYLQEGGNPRANTIELIYDNLGYPLEELLNERDPPPDSESPDSKMPDFLSLVGSLKTIHPLLMPVVFRSYQMAQDIVQLSDMLYNLENDRDNVEL